MFIIEGINSKLIRQGMIDKIDIDEIIPFFDDDNVYVIKMTKRCLKTALSFNLEEAGKFIKKSSSQINILLPCLYVFGYSVPSSLKSVSCKFGLII